MLCKDLGIDDPVAWLNAAPPAVVDGWLAFYLVQQEDMKSEPKKKMQTPEQALQRLQGKAL